MMLVRASTPLAAERLTNRGAPTGASADWRWLWILAPTWTSVLVIAAVWLAAIGRKRRR